MEKSGRKGRAARRTAAVLAAMALLTSGAMAAEENEVSGRTLIPVGRTVGIKLFSDGVMVVGFSQVPAAGGEATPARTCGLKEGDIITHINSAEVDTIEEVRACLEEIGGEKMSIRALRDGRQVQVTAQAVQCSSDGHYKLGAWLRDSMAGIGTVTWYDPVTGSFGALGHGINDVDTARLMPMESGGVLSASVTDVKKGKRGEPGELHGAFETERDLGSLTANTCHGIFGKLADGSLVEGLEAVEVAEPDEVKNGRAVICATVAGSERREYEVEITRLRCAEGDGRELMVKVTDPELLEATGGIVQGMSGSPILQNGKLVGAVTHVLVDDPTQGYGILMETMLEAAG